jgi:carbon-monoxide dehydrogenase small subunit
MLKQITVTVNGKQYSADVEPRLLLVHFIREVINLTGTHIGCDTSNCGACTILLDGKSINYDCGPGQWKKPLQHQALHPRGPLHPLQEGFKENHGLQGLLQSPGMILRCGITEGNKNPTEDEIVYFVNSAGMVDIIISCGRFMGSRKCGRRNTSSEPVFV